MLRATPRILFVVFLCALATMPVWGQTTIVNPRTVEFDPSADHSAVTAGGDPLVGRYELLVFLQGAAQPITTISLGKPAPDPDGKIRVDFSTLLVGWPLANGTYEARVAAVGPDGSAESAPSNLFDFQSAPPPPPPVVCSYALSTSGQSVGTAGGATSVTLTATDPTCAWTATSAASWIAVAPASGTGTASITVSVSANTGTARMAAATIGGQSFTVTQVAAPVCTFSVGSNSVNAPANPSTAAVALTASSPGCGWTASTGTGWITVTAASGTGSASVGYSVAKNGTTSTRTGTLTVAGQVVTVTQAAAERPKPPKGVKTSIMTR